MTGAALALAAALVVWPAAPRRLADLRTHRRRRLRAWPVVAVLGVAVAWAVPVPVALALGAAAGTAALRRRQRLAQQRRERESAALQAALDVLVGELRIGAHPVSAGGTAAGEVCGPVGDGMRAVAARARIRSARGLSICQNRNTATLRRTAQRDIVERDRRSARGSAAMAGPRATATGLAGLPAAGIGLGQLIGAEPLAFLLAPGAGGWLLIIGVL
mgnify:CR=1 FL=1